MSNDTIVSAAIYPPIGVCRVGNSPEKFYIGPEVPDPAPLSPDAYRDDQGRLSPASRILASSSQTSLALCCCSKRSNFNPPLTFP